MTLQIDIRFTDPSPNPSPAGNLWRLLPRYGMTGEPDPLATAQKVGSAPDVIKLKDGPTGVTFTRDWQMYLKAINPNLTDNQLSGIMMTDRWGFNRTGVQCSDPRIPYYRNYIKNEDTDRPDPYTDKVRSFRDNIHAGVVDGSDVVLQTFDGTKPPPPLSPVPDHPEIVYYNPQEHPYMYCVLTIVYADGIAREWSAVGTIAGYKKQAAIFPLVAAFSIRVPLSLVAAVDEWAMPY